jgi:hypothetical protein
LAQNVKVLGTSTIQSVQIIKDSKFIHKTEPHANAAEFDYTDTSTAPWPGRAPCG